MDQKDFSYTALKLEIKKAEKIKELYHLCKTLDPIAYSYPIMPFDTMGHWQNNIPHHDYEN